VVDLVHALAKQDKMPEGLKISTKTGTIMYDSALIAGVDYVPDDHVPPEPSNHDASNNQDSSTEGNDDSDNQEADGTEDSDSETENSHSETKTQVMTAKTTPSQRTI
jgi:hypothetical protein